MVNYTNRIMTALESAMGHEIAWPDHQERAVNSVHFAELSFPGCIGLIDCTLVKLSQRRRDDGETYFQQKIAHSWSQEHCTAYQITTEQHKDGFLRCKSVQVLYDFGICTKEVIVIDDTVQKISPNHPFQAVHPRLFNAFKTAKNDENYLSKVLQPFLDKFRGNKGDDISYVQAN
ncbi:hypothetical protein R1sor_024899 [Riccia sorocarpa]|uniref:FCP1 homology domain-containing protein n=1 Tax=Riccia sorocarpa TaxID=122646 RepID=A0ABD3GRZ7_9MARC